jgi:hypothetical protein
VSDRENTKLSISSFQTKLGDASDILSKRSETFLTSWSFITSRILQELTLKGAPMFGKFNDLTIDHLTDRAI